MFFNEASIDALLEAGERLQTAGRDAIVFSLFLQLGGLWRTRLHEILALHEAGEATLMTELPKELSAKVGNLSRTLHELLKTLEMELSGVTKNTTMHQMLDMDLSEFGIEQHNQYRQIVRDATLVQDHMHELLDEAEEKIESLRSRLHWQESVNKDQVTELAKLRGLANR